jgi:mediator of RNA polymerase II transcription subunit 6
MFYDKQSNNQVLRMQTMHTGMPIVNEAEELKYVIAMFGMFSMSPTLLALHRRFTGIEFAVVHAQPPSMFVIHKRERISPDEGA